MNVVDEASAMTTLSAACEINPPKPKLANISDETDILFVPMAAVDELKGAVTGSEIRRLAAVKGKSYTTFAPGDILFAKITPCMENGKAAVVPPIKSGLGFGSTEFHVLRPRPGATARYIWHLVRQQSFRDLAEEHMTGSVGQARVPASFLRDYTFALPDEPTQERVADVLDAALAHAESIAAKLARARLLLRRARASTLAAAIAGRLTENWRESHAAEEDATELFKRVDAARRERLGKRFRPGLVPEDKYPLPHSWTWVTLGALVDVATGATPRRGRSDYYGGSIPWVTSGAVNTGFIETAKEYITELAVTETNAKLFPKGTLLLAMYGEGQTRGKVAELGIDAATNQAVAALLFDEVTSVLRPFLRLFLLSNYERIRELSFGGVQPNLSLAVVRDTAIPLPPLDEQAEICARADQLLRTIGRVEERIASSERATNRSTDAVSSKAFRGELILAGAAL